MSAPAFSTAAFPSWPFWDADEEQRLQSVLKSGLWGSSRGPHANGFAAAFARFQGASIGLALANGTCTLETALVACGIGHGDEVVVPALTFMATAGAVLRVNAVPVIVDVDPNSLCIDVDALVAAITPRTRAVIPVHLAGAMCDMDRLVSLCERGGLALIEDCAHAHGSRWSGRGAGTFGVFGSFSFQQSKLMTAGEGGALITSDENLAAAARSYLNCGRRAGGHTYDHVRLGVNYRMTDWQGSILAAQLDRYPGQLALREANADRLSAALTRIPGLRPQARDPRIDVHAQYCYVFHYDAAEFGGLPADAFEEELKAEGVPMSGSYPSLPELAMFKVEGALAPHTIGLPAGYRPAPCPVARDAAASTIWLHHRVLLAEPETVLRIAELCERIRAQAKGR